MNKRKNEPADTQEANVQKARLEIYVRAALLEAAGFERQIRKGTSNLSKEEREELATAQLRHPEQLRLLAKHGRTEYVIESDPGTGGWEWKKVGERPPRTFPEEAVEHMTKRLEAAWREAIYPARRAFLAEVLGEEEPEHKPWERLRDLTVAELLIMPPPGEQVAPEEQLRQLQNAVECALEREVLGGPKSRLAPIPLEEAGVALAWAHETVEEAEARHAESEAHLALLREEGPALVTPGEWEVVGLVLDGLTDKEIAERRGCAETTVRVQRWKAKQKLKAALQDTPTG